MEFITHLPISQGYNGYLVLTGFSSIIHSNKGALCKIGGCEDVFKNVVKYLGLPLNIMLDNIQGSHGGSR
jgi:hypothetical protein